MPQINLLSPALGKKSKKEKAAKAVKLDLVRIHNVAFSVSLLVIICLVGVWIAFGMQVSKNNKIFQALLEKEKRFAIDPDGLAKLKNVKEGLQERISFIEDLLFTKFLWSEKLEAVADVIPFGVWLTTISMEKRKVRDRESSFESKTFKFLGITGDSKEHYLAFIIAGKAAAATIQDELGLIGDFNNALKKNELFFRDFHDIELKNVNKGTIMKTDVMSFEFVCPFK